MFALGCWVILEEEGGRGGLSKNSLVFHKNKEDIH